MTSESCSPCPAGAGLDALVSRLFFKQCCGGRVGVEVLLGLPGAPLAWKDVFEIYTRGGSGLASNQATIFLEAGSPSGLSRSLSVKPPLFVLKQPYNGALGHI